MPARWVERVRRCGAMRRALRGIKHDGGIPRPSQPRLPGCDGISWSGTPRPPHRRKSFIVSPFSKGPSVRGGACMHHGQSRCGGFEAPEVPSQKCFVFLCRCVFLSKVLQQKMPARSRATWQIGFRLLPIVKSQKMQGVGQRGTLVESNYYY